MSEQFINPKRIPDAMLPKGWVFDKELSTYSDIDITKNYCFIYSCDNLDLMVKVSYNACGDLVTCDDCDESDSCDNAFRIYVSVGTSPMQFLEDEDFETKTPDEANQRALDYMKC